MFKSCLAWGGLLLACVLASPTQAVYEKQDGFPWNLTLHGEHDAEMAKALPNGSFFMNVGPTGIRAQITHQHPAFFTVKYVFQNSPAAGKIKPGDIIVGANGHVMDVPHQFGRRNITGWSGPMEEMAKLIENSQGKDGKLELMVWHGGDRGKPKKVELQIAPVGRFSDTYPFNCERSDRLMKQLNDWLANEYERTGKFGRQHVTTASILSLMASGDNEYSRIIKRAMAGYQGRRYSALNGAGFQCWGLGLDGIVIGEYYLLTKDRSLIPAAESLAVAVAESQNWENGGFSHRPYPVIARRVADGGPSGYGPMSGVTGLVMLGQSLFKAGGLEISDEAYERMHQGYLSSWSNSGAIGYGMESWHRAVIEPVGDSVGKARNDKGIGFPVPTGMEGVDTFKLIWPTDKDRRGGPTDWLKNKQELEHAKVYIIGKNKLLVIRDMARQAPQSPPRLGNDRVSHIFRSGGAALAHAIGNEDNKPWQYMAAVYANGCANSPNALLDGHASTLMHTLWGSLGASYASPEKFVKYMQGIRWWFVMAQTHDGSFVPMPGRDYASTDHVYAGRNFPTATAALILSVKDGHIRITGKGVPHPGRDTPVESNRPRRADRTGSSTGSGSSTTGTPREAPVVTLFGDDFKVQHCIKEARALNEGASYATVLRMLDEAVVEPGPHGSEAGYFGMLLREWLQKRNTELLKQAETKPAQTLASARDHVKRLKGYSVPHAMGLEARIELLQEDRDVSTLARYFEQADRIAALEAKRGSTSSTTSDKKQIAAMVERFLEKDGLSDMLTAEANALLKRLDAAGG